MEGLEPPEPIKVTAFETVPLPLRFTSPKWGQYPHYLIPLEPTPDFLIIRTIRNLVHGFHHMPPSFAFRVTPALPVDPAAIQTTLLSLSSFRSVHVALLLLGATSLHSWISFHIRVSYKNDNLINIINLQNIKSIIRR